eukprot:scaffold1239_cov175-Pinguiococcus_pyrenoidosus.AAC.50
MSPASKHAVGCIACARVRKTAPWRRRRRKNRLSHAFKLGSSTPVWPSPSRWKIVVLRPLCVMTSPATLREASVINCRTASAASVMR